MPERHFVKYTFLKVDPAWRRLDADRPRRRQARVPRRLRGLRRRAAAAGVLDRRHARGLRPDAALAGHEPRADPRVPRGALPERPDAVVLEPYSFLAMTKPSEYSDESRLEVRARALEVPVRLSVREDARVVPAVAGGALQGHAGAHPHRPRVPPDRPQHELLVRARRPGVRRRLRDRRARRLPRPRAAPAHHRGLGLHKRDTPTFTCVSDLASSARSRRSTATP